ncbi:hypothetical protein C8K30_101976 [Promicromonospora sp. AC04]|uniref:hypothetical protein n=1 Tax=Promicromonospora sp. AC04 TaxID=2135723 RepID=UPI000D3A2714|nr:hypothetical protein [Promicromonospora sp. AC04]PUB32450.1 hypothetical protein C8K30_101976 [Promicromonospora sp. AC04]
MVRDWSIPVDVVSPPSVVDWVTAIGTLAAVGVAVWVAWREQKHGREDREERRRENRQAQASLVNAWIGTFLRTGDPRDDMMGSYVVHNGSTAPIYEFRAILPAGFAGMKPYHTSPIMLVPTERPRDLGFEAEPVEFSSDAPVEITFRDAAGIWWRRTTDGLLRELAGRPEEDADEVEATPTGSADS